MFGGAISNKNYILGIDPGLSGGLAVLDPINQDIICGEIMPAKDLINRREIDPYDLSKIIEPYCNDIKFAVLEDVFSMPGQGVASMFSFGVTKGMIMGVLGAYQIKMIRTQPSIWKLAMKLDSNKQKSFDLASKLFSRQQSMWRLKKQEGVAEAALIAKFGERFF